ncbi:class I SAM-dependent methyltransferase [Bizionia sediminis]|uniref:Class I SAM-dependent methyltransferase n=1 Tax=Bizionia sediminis TaxID=1737064 RepID=A0ABW5KSA8_9FLAO
MKTKENVFQVIDYSVSNESFHLKKHSDFDILVTTPQPKAEGLYRYYKSEDYISHTDARRNSFEKLYHLVREFALKRKLALIKKYGGSKKRLLDVGCGTGEFIQKAQQQNWQVTGVEPNEGARRLANVKTENAVTDIDALPLLTSKSFDVITLWHVLEHLPNLHEQINVFKKLLTDDGALVVAVPNFKSFDAQHYKNFWAAYDVPRHLWHFSEKGMKQLMAHHGLQVVAVKPMIFDAFYVSLLSEKYKSGNMNFIKAFLIGAKSNWHARHTGAYSSLIYIIKKQ